MSKDKYSCKSCKRRFNENEYSFTNDKNLCIFHCIKDKWFEIDDKGNKNWISHKRNINFFWKSVQSELYDLDDTSYYNPDILKHTIFYDKVIFPKFQEEVEYCSFKDNIDEMGTNFYIFAPSNNPQEQKIPTVIAVFDKLNIKFKNCHFLGETYFTKYGFEKDILFDERCTFDEDVDFAKKEFIGKIDFINCIFKGNVKFSHSIFNKSVNFTASTFIKNVDFRSCMFNGIVYFDFCTVKEKLIFSFANFNENVTLIKSSIANGNIIHATFNKYVTFNESKFGLLNLDRTSFIETADFIGLKNLDNEKIKTTNIANRDTARNIKFNLEKNGNIIDSNIYYPIEMEKREKELTFKNDLLDKLVFSFHGFTSNHSQNWVLPLFWIIIIGIVSSLFEFNFLTPEKIENLNLLPGFFKGFTKEIVIAIFIVGLTSSCLFTLIKLNKLMLFFIILQISIGIYIYHTGDVLFKLVSKTINPFSVMKNADDINILQLFSKIIITYLIYQLIISTRQNTRRK